MATLPAECVHLTSTHPPFDTRVFQKECKTLADEGMKVTLIVPHSESLFQDGVRIRAVPKPQNGRERLTTTTNLVYKAALEENPAAIFHFHDSELIPHMLLLKLRGRRVLYDAHEDTPRQVQYQHWIPNRIKGPVANGMRALEFLGDRLFDHIIAAEPIIADNFRKERTLVLHNYPVLAEFSGHHSTTAYTTRPMRLAFVGGISAVRGVKELVSAMGIVSSTLDARLTMGGSFYPSTLRQEVEQLQGWQQVDFKGWLSRQEVQKVYGNARIGIITRHPIERHLSAMPTKLFEYMAAGLPVVASNLPTIRPIIERHRCGLLVNPLDPTEIAHAIKYLLEHPQEAEQMGRRGLEAVRTRYSWEAEKEKLIRLYQSMKTS